MRIARFVAIGAVAVAVMGSAPVHADFRGEVESARANARAGGPVSEHDAELLERWGCLSGTRNPVCDRSNQARRYYRERRRYRR
jgi:hypothetical protein